ncbi:MAG: hypothetical protein MJ232_01670 [archaeon]|nr:hypothetical protein [archaeon]
MKGLINTGYVLVLLASISLGVLSSDLPNIKGLMWSGIVISVIGLFFTNLFMKESYKQDKEFLYKAAYYISIVIVVIDFFVVVKYAMGIPDLTNKIQIALGLKQEIVIDTVADVYTYDDEFKITFDYQTNFFTVQRDEEGTLRYYTLTLTDLNENKQNDIKMHYHGKVDINKENVVCLYGIFEPCDEGTSIATPYLELTSGVYGIEGNQIIIDDVFSKVFHRENIFKNKILTISGLVQDGTSLKSGTLEEYYTDDNLECIYNGKRVYKDVYICNDYAKLNTQEKLAEYISYLGLERDKMVSKIQGKEIKIGGDVVNKIRLYYYNNLDSLNFIEIIFTGKKDSIIIKESDAKFKFDNIQKLY